MDQVVVSWSRAAQESTGGTRAKSSRQPVARPARGCVVILFALVCVLAGCATTGPDTSRNDLWRHHLGIRPDEPAIDITSKRDRCDEYKDYVTYAQRLQEAYHSRASQNRVWIYVAGILGLGAVAATGGLAAVGAAAGTLALVTLSGGFSASAFATINNSDLAKIYTISANRIDLALKEAESGFPPNDRHTDTAACGQALRILRDGVWEARTTLEISRTDTAVAALVRAKEQQKVLNDQIAGLETADVTRVVLTADITAISPEKQPEKSKATQVALTIKNIRLDKVAQADVKVLVGSQELALDGPAQLGADGVYLVKFTAPADPPSPETNVYAPTLLVGKSKQRVVSQRGKTFTYQ